MCLRDQIWPIPQQKSFPGGKGWSSCNVVRQSQMLIIGGELTNTSNPECDIPKIGGQHNMWLGQENVDYGDNGVPNWWHAPMDNVTEYRVPDQIATSIGGEYGYPHVESGIIILIPLVLKVVLPGRHPRWVGQPRTYPYCSPDNSQQSQHERQ